MNKFKTALHFLSGLALLLCTSCNKPVTLKTMSGDEFTENNLPHVYIFLNTECPICQKYQGSLKQYRSDSVRYYFVFPGKQDLQSVREFIDYDSLEPETVIRDTALKLTQALGATLTPQSVVRLNGNKRYSGLIDDRFVTLASSKPKPTVNYIRKALNSLRENERAEIKDTKAVGCFIESY